MADGRSCGFASFMTPSRKNETTPYAYFYSHDTMQKATVRLIKAIATMQYVKYSFSRWLWRQIFIERWSNHELKQYVHNHWYILSSKRVIFETIYWASYTLTLASLFKSHIYL